MVSYPSLCVVVCRWIPLDFAAPRMSSLSLAFYAGTHVLRRRLYPALWLTFLAGLRWTSLDFAELRKLSQIFAMARILDQESPPALLLRLLPVADMPH